MVSTFIKSVPIEGIRLAREGDFVVIRIQVRGHWIEVAREHRDGALSCIVDPNAIERKIRVSLSATERRKYYDNG